MRCTPKWATRRRPERESFGGELQSIGARLGQPFMPWQDDAAMVAGEIDPVTGLPAYRQVIITVPRQTGKTTLYLTFEIHRCTSPRWPQPQRAVFTAQSGKDARDKWLDELFPLMRRSEMFKPRGPLVSRIYEGMGNEYVKFRNGSLIRLLSSSTSTGHSKTIHQAVLDEIWHDTDGRREQGLRPAMITVADAQLLVCSTAGTDASVVYDRKIAQGREAVQKDTGSGICYIEYSAPDGWDPADEDSYFGFMPALCPKPPCRCGDGKWRHTVTLEAIRAERRDMTSEDFSRAYGNLPDRSGKRGAEIAAFRDAWPYRADPSSKIDGPLAVGVSVAPGGSSAAVAVAGRRADGRSHAELTALDGSYDHRPGTDWVIARADQLVREHSACALVLNPAGAAGSLEKELIERGYATGKPKPGKLQLHLTPAHEFSAGCGSLTQDVINDRMRHLGQKPLDDAVTGAGTRYLADAWAWAWRTSAADIAPLEAVTLARIGFATYGARPGVFFMARR